MNEAASQPASPASRFPRRRALQAVVVLFMAWLAGLVWLVARTSNPVTINVAQLLMSDCVVVADVTDAELGEFARVETIIGDEPPETFRVLATSRITGPESPRWLLALHREREGQYSVVPVPYRDQELLLVYPGDEATIAQARRLLRLE